MRFRLFAVLLLSVSLIGCGGDSEGAGGVDVPTVIDYKPEISRLFLDNVSRYMDHYSAAEGVVIGVKYVLTDDSMNDADSSRVFWVDNNGLEIKSGTYLTLTDSHLGGVKACAEPILHDGTKGEIFCSPLIKVSAKPVLADFFHEVYISHEDDHFYAVAVWIETQPEELWEIRWFDPKGYVQAKGKGLPFKDIKTDAVKACVYDTKIKECIGYTEFEVAPDYNIPEIWNLRTYSAQADHEFGISLKASHNWVGIDSGLSHNDYRWVVDGATEQTNSDTFALSKQHIGANISVCVVGYFRNYRSNTLTASQEYCSPAKTYREENLRVSYDNDPLVANLTVEGFNYIVSGSFNSEYPLKKQDFEIFINDQVVQEGEDYTLTLSDKNHFTLDINALPKDSKFEFGCYFTYMKELYSCTPLVGSDSYPSNVGPHQKMEDFSTFIARSFSTDFPVDDWGGVEYLGYQTGDDVTWYTVSPVSGVKTKLPEKSNDNIRNFSESTFAIEPHHYGEKLFVTVERKNGQRFEYNFEGKIMGPEVTQFSDKLSITYNKLGKLSTVVYEFCNIGDKVDFYIVSPTTGDKWAPLFNMDTGVNVQHGTCQYRDASWVGWEYEKGNRLLLTVLTADGEYTEYDFDNVLIGSALDL